MPVLLFSLFPLHELPHGQGKKCCDKKGATQSKMLLRDGASQFLFSKSEVLLLLLLLFSLPRQLDTHRETTSALAQRWTILDYIVYRYSY